MTNPTRIKPKKDNSNYKPTRTHKKRIKSDNDLTSTQLSIRKQTIEDYCSKRLEDFDKSWSRYYFSNTTNDFVKLLDYYQYPRSTKIKKQLEGINFERIERETTDNLIESLDQARQVINSLNKSYRQKIIDSKELSNFVLALLELDEWTESKGVQKFTFAQNLFNIAMKIMIEQSPKPIQKHLVESLKSFYDFASLPIELNYKHDKEFLKPNFKRIQGTDYYKIELITQLKSTKPK